MNNDALPLLSVVVPTLNRCQMLARLLHSLEVQSLAPTAFEVIVVDDGSTAAVVDELNRMAAASALTIRVVQNPDKGTGAARNHGALQLAHGRFVAFMDDDVVVRNDCLANALAHFDRDGNALPLGIVEACLLTLGTHAPFLKRADAQGFVTNAIFYRRELFQQLGGFDAAFFDHTTGLFFRDDLDLGFRALEAGFWAIQPYDVVAWHPAVPHEVAAAFKHARRCRVDPLLFRKHPRLFAQMLERKRLGRLRFGRPLHRTCAVHCLAMLTLTGAFATGALTFGLTATGLAGLSYLTVRVKFQGRRAFQLWKLSDSLAFLVFPWYYFAQYLSGCRQHGGWKSLL